MSLPLVFDTCTPRDDVLKGQLAEGEFAARLGPVIARAGSPDYHDPVLFFRNTYPTKGLKELLDQVLRRLTGTGGSVSSVFRLDTSFGGGKTHGLIALIHAAREGSAIPNLNEFVEGVPAMSGAAVAAFDGEAADPTNGRLMGDGIRAHTPWGEIAYQLGGAAGYATVKASDEARVAPGSDTMREVIGDGPALIVLDELGEYLRKCPEANGRDQLAAFIKAIFSAVESSPRAALVFTLALRSDGTATDAFSAENQQLAKFIGEVESVSGRKATILNPTGDDETVPVLRRRLFDRVSPCPPEVLSAYQARWTDRVEPGHGNAAQRFVDAYPFHPDLIDTLTDKTATIAEFQRVRGMLRILAKSVATLWAKRPSDAHAIHTHHVDLGVDEIRREFTTRLGQSAYVPAVMNDIAGTKEKPALAESLDARDHGGLPPYCSYLARTIFVNTIAFNNDLKGLSRPQLRFAMASPIVDLDMLDAATDRFIADSAYLDDRPGAPLRFNADANLTQIINREERQVDKEVLRTELDSRIKDIFGGTRSTFELIAFPSGPFDVPDDVGEGRPRLVVLHHAALPVSASLDEVPEMVASIFTRKGAEGERIRMLRNNLVFLLADEKSIAHMESQMAKRLALRELKRPERLMELADHQKQQVIQLEQQSELSVATAIQGCYKHMLYPSKNTLGDGSVPLAHAVLDNHSTSANPGTGQLQVQRQLENSNKLRMPEDNPDQPAFIRDRTKLKKDGQMTTGTLRQEFRQDPTLPIHIGDDPLQKLIRKGIEDGIFVYRRGELTAGKGEPLPAIVIDEMSQVFTADYAKDHGIWPRPAPPPAPPPTTSGTPYPGVGPTGGPGVVEPFVDTPAPGGGTGTAPTAPTPTAQASTFHKEGPLRDALSQLFLAVKSAKAASIATLRIAPMDHEAAFKLLPAAEAIPGARKTVAIEADIATAAGGDLSLQVKGTLGEVRPLRDYLEPQIRASSEKAVQIVLEFAFENGLKIASDEPDRLIERLTKFGSGAAYVEATAEI